MFFSNTGILLEVPLAATISRNPSARFFEGEDDTGATAVTSRCCFSTLLRAAARGDEEVRLLINNGAGLEKIHTKPGRAGIAALSEAVETSKEYSVRLLSQYGPELEILATGEQSLGLATKQGNVTTVRDGGKGGKN
jgi:hypothetical protein